MIKMKLNCTFCKAAHVVEDMLPTFFKRSLFEFIENHKRCAAQEKIERRKTVKASTPVQQLKPKTKLACDDCNSYLNHKRCAKCVGYSRHNLASGV